MNSRTMERLCTLLCCARNPIALSNVQTPVSRLQFMMRPMGDVDWAKTVVLSIYHIVLEVNNLNTRIKYRHSS